MDLQKHERDIVQVCEYEYDYESYLHKQHQKFNTWNNNIQARQWNVYVKHSCAQTVNTGVLHCVRHMEVDGGWLTGFALLVHQTDLAEAIARVQLIDLTAGIKRRLLCPWSTCGSVNMYMDKNKYITFFKISSSEITAYYNGPFPNCKSW